MKKEEIEEKDQNMEIEEDLNSNFGENNSKEIEKTDSQAMEEEFENPEEYVKSLQENNFESGLAETQGAKQQQEMSIESPQSRPISLDKSPSGSNTPAQTHSHTRSMGLSQTKSHSHQAATSASNGNLKGSAGSMTPLNDQKKTNGQSTATKKNKEKPSQETIEEFYLYKPGASIVDLSNQGNNSIEVFPPFWVVEPCSSSCLSKVDQNRSGIHQQSESVSSEQRNLGFRWLFEQFGRRLHSQTCWAAIF